MNTGQVIRISVTDGARLFGLSTKTIRQAIRKSEISYIVSRGRYKINFESLLNWSQASTRRRVRADNFGIGQYVDKWKINNRKFSPRPPQ